MSLILPSSKSIFESLKISKFRFISGIIIGLLYAFVFYAWLYVCREVLRFSPVLFNADFFSYPIIVLSEKSIDFYNLFMAFISLILGQSICFVHWIDKPKKLYSRLKVKRLYVINDQRVFNWFFLNWFSRIAMLVGLMAHFLFLDLAFVNEYNFFFLLIIAVLFLQTWSSIRVLFKKDSLKFMIIAFVVISILSLSMSRINVFDYKSFNHNLFSLYPYYKYDMQMPRSNVYQNIEKKSLVQNIYVIYDTNQREYKLLLDGQIADLEDLKLYVPMIKDNTADDLRNKLIWNCHIDHSTSMMFVNELKAKLVQMYCLKIGYVVEPYEDVRLYQRMGLPSMIVKLPVYDKYFEDSIYLEAYPLLPPPPYPFTFKEVYQSNIYSTLNINQFDKNNFCVNDTIVADSKLKSILRTFVEENDNYIIHYYINDSDVYQDYISILSLVNEVIDELRNEYSAVHFGVDFDDLDRTDADMVIEEFPMRLFEITQDLLSAVDN